MGFAVRSIVLCQPLHGIVSQRLHCWNGVVAGWDFSRTRQW